MRLPLQLALIAFWHQYSDFSCCGSQAVSRHMVLTPKTYSLNHQAILNSIGSVDMAASPFLCNGLASARMSGLAFIFLSLAVCGNSLNPVKSQLAFR